MGNLPAESTSFIGRSGELAALDGLLGQHRLVTVTGPGGVGKSRVALRAAKRIEDRYPDGVWWVELSPLRDRDLLAATVADAFDVTDQSLRTACEALCGRLADKHSLLVLDTCEHLISACGHLIGELLQASPGLTVLATSRQPLGRPQERVFPLEPLPVAGAALTLFKERATEAAPHLSFDDPVRAAAATDVCRRLDGIPLALELACARLKLWSVEQLAARLGSRFEVLTGTGTGTGAGTGVGVAALPRHQAMRTAIGWSHELCEPLERLLWARLSVFAGGFDLAAAQAIGAGGPLPARAVEQVLAGLVDKSVVRTRLEPSGRLGHRMLDTIREYGLRWLDELGETHEVADRHARRFRHIAHEGEAAWMGPGQLDWYVRLEAEHADLRTALEHLLATDPEAALDMAGSLWFVWFCCGRLREGRAYLQRALDGCPGPGPHRAAAVWALGMCAFLQGDFVIAHRLGEESSRAARDPEQRLRAAYLYGGSVLMPGDPERALDILDPALAQDTGFSPGRALCALARIFALNNLERYTEASAEAVRLRDECAARGERWMRAYADYMLAAGALALGRPAEAAAHVRAMLAGKRLLHDSFGIAMGLDLLACAVAAQGDGEDGALLLGIGQECWRTVGKAQMGAPELAAVREQCERRARAALGDGAFDSAFGRGVATGLDDGLVLALKGPRRHRS
ncbi:NB-ARC domain-containing protein [Streptomyces sp. NPDC006632]|uniref:ATP-binding protein n=1 Tax=Streptomyces sp. NPDC006632 TaxID=3157182 RepID=UPI0033BF1A06